MSKRSRTSIKNQEIIDKNANKIKDLILEKREVYKKFVKSTEEHNLVIEKVSDKLNLESNTMKPDDVIHFKSMLRQRHDKCFNLLHECSDKIKVLDKEHYNLVNENSKLF
jgi:hypothetical protein